MSGGHYDYVCFKIQEIKIDHTNTDRKRAAFQKLLELVGNAMYEIEWVDSGDKSEGDEYAAIDACFAMLKASPDNLIKAAAYDRLTENLKKWLELETKESK